MNNDPLKLFQDYLDRNLTETLYIDILESKHRRDSSRYILSSLHSNSQILFNSFLTHRTVKSLIPKLLHDKRALIQKAETSFNNISSDWVEKMNLFHLVGSCARLSMTDILADACKSYNNNDIVLISIKNMQILYGKSKYDNANELIQLLDENNKLLCFYKKYIRYYYEDNDLLKSIIVALADEKLSRLPLLVPIIFSLGHESQFSSASNMLLEKVQEKWLGLQSLPSCLKDYPLEEMISSWKAEGTQN